MSAPASVQGVPVRTVHGSAHRANPAPAVPSKARRAKLGAAPAVEVPASMAPLKDMTNPYGFDPFSNKNLDAERLRKDMQRAIPLAALDLQSEGLPSSLDPQGGIDDGGQAHVIRVTADIAKQITDANLGSIIGPSRVVPNSILVFANIVDTEQSATLTNRLRLDAFPEAPNAASFSQNANGIFSQGVFRSIFPSIDNGPTYTPEVKVNLK